MVETEWPEIGGKEVRYRDARWELTGSVDVQDDGALLAPVLAGLGEGSVVADQLDATAQVFGDGRRDCLCDFLVGVVVDFDFHGVLGNSPNV